MRCLSVLGLAVLIALSASCGGGGGAFKGVTLPTLDGSKKVALDSCPTARCLTVYVAPWCGACHAATPAIQSVQRFMKWRGIDMRVIVGLDKEREVRAFAAEFGPESLLDLSRQVNPRGGVPHLYLSGPDGKVFREQAGFWAEPEPAIAWALK